MKIVPKGNNSIQISVENEEKAKKFLNGVHGGGDVVVAMDLKNGKGEEWSFWKKGHPYADGYFTIETKNYYGKILTATSEGVLKIEGNYDIY